MQTDQDIHRILLETYGLVAPPELRGANLRAYLIGVQSGCHSTSTQASNAFTRTQAGEHEAWDRGFFDYRVHAKTWASHLPERDERQ